MCWEDLDVLAIVVMLCIWAIVVGNLIILEKVGKVVSDITMTALNKKDSPCALHRLWHIGRSVDAKWLFSYFRYRKKILDVVDNIFTTHRKVIHSDCGATFTVIPWTIENILFNSLTRSPVLFATIHDSDALGMDDGSLMIVLPRGQS